MPPMLWPALDVSESGFVAHCRKENRQRRKKDVELRALILQSCEQIRNTYGSPRVRLDLRELGHRCGKNRVARLMRESGLRARQKRRFRPRTTDSGHSHKIAENWLAKVPAPDRPGQLWQSDITYLETQQGWLYLAFTLDACSRRYIAHHCRQDMVAELTTTTPGNYAGDPGVLGHHFRADHSESVLHGHRRRDGIRIELRHVPDGRTVGRVARE
jgi:putative transposase